jgi:hypothetical protein
VRLSGNDFSILRVTTRISPIRVLYGWWGGYMGTHAHPVRGTGKITFGVAAKPDDELSKFHSIRKFPLVPRKLSMLLDF